MKKLMKLLSISIMLLGILFSVSNFLTTNLEAKGIDVSFTGGKIIGTIDPEDGSCTGPPLNC